MTFGVVLAVFQNCEMAPDQRGIWDRDDYSSMTPTPTPTPGPDDLRYVLGGWACGSKDLLGPSQITYNVRSIFLDVTPTVVRQITNYFTACTRTQSFLPAYPNATTLSITHGPTECSNCVPTQCYNVGTPNPSITVTYSMTKTSSTLTLKRVLSVIDVNDPTSVYKQAGCLSGEIETLTYIRQ